MNAIRNLRGNTRGTTAAEFALVLPLAIFLLFGIIDAGRYVWRINEAEKAAQMAVRYAVVTDMVEGGFNAKTYVGDTNCGNTLTAGDPICKAALGEVSCNDTSCTCVTTPCPSSSYQSQAFTKILNRAKLAAPFIQASNLKVEYSGSGLGYASDPSIAIAPVVTVRLHNLTFPAISLLGSSLDMPTVMRSLTLEDGKGTASN